MFICVLCIPIFYCLITPIAVKISTTTSYVLEIRSYLVSGFASWRHFYNSRASGNVWSLENVHSKHLPISFSKTLTVWDGEWRRFAAIGMSVTVVWLEVRRGGRDALLSCVITATVRAYLSAVGSNSLASEASYNVHPSTRRLQT